MTNGPAASLVHAERGRRPPVIRSVAILGAGTMGAQIAAAFRERRRARRCCSTSRPTWRAQGLDRARDAQAGSVLHAGSRGSLITTGGFDTDLARDRDADWIIEAVVERLDVKRQLLARVDDGPARRRHRQLEHVGHPDRGAGRGPLGRFPPPLAGHALLQSAAVPAPPRDDPDGGDRSGRSSPPCARSPITGSARASSSRRTRRTSSPTTSPSTA